MPTAGASNPTRRSGLVKTEVGGQTMLYNVEDEAVHVLNPAARLIWNLCDGEHNLEDMAQALRNSFAVPPDRDLMADVRTTLQVLTSKGLVERVTS